MDGIVLASVVLPDNRLGESPSPYLAMHGQDAIKWQTWSPETLDLARRSGRLLLVSVGYYACYWCHVMHRESYEDPHIATYLNAHFIPVKVDRELNAGLDEELQHFADALVQRGGWPLNAFVTPEGYPLSVVLYQRPKDFLNTLRRVQMRWSKDGGTLGALARAAAPHPAPIPFMQYAAGEREALLKSFLDSVQEESDTLQGGFGEASKFPHVPQLNLLLAVQSIQPDPKREAWLRLTLDAMADRALRDHVYGGFFRYTIDPGWSVPHFEKMLYDNAQLATLYLTAAKMFNEPRYHDVARSTLDFMLTVLRDASSGGFCSSTSAMDRQGREGAAYLWSEDSLKAILSPAELEVGRKVWRLGHSPFESGDFLPAEYEQVKADERDAMDSAYRKLRAARPAIDAPLDRKMLTGLNGMALSALSHAADLGDRYRKAAFGSYKFLASQWRNGRLAKGQAGIRILPGAELEDYALGATGLLDFARAFKNGKAKSLARQWVEQGWKTFSDSAGWKQERAPLLKSARPAAILEDGVIPSPSTALISVSLRLNDPELARKARNALGWRSELMQRDPFAYPGQIGLLNDLSDLH